jgi:adenylate cyclase
MPGGALFLSYASEDADAAQRICEVLRAAGVEVWFDRNELRGGDVWDQRIRREIHRCGLFIPIISANTVSRREGYFRLEWDLADQRTHMLARDRVFIVPVCIDATLDSSTDVPESFGRVQWSRLVRGETPPAFVERVQRLLSAEPAPARPSATPSFHPTGETRETSASPRAPQPSMPVPALLALAVALIGLGYLAVDKFVLSGRPAAGAGTELVAHGTGVAQPRVIPEKSIAVLPFVDMSEKRDQDYFSDGLTEEMIDLLGQVPDLRVPARTSSFYFKGRTEDVAAIAQKLRVAHVLEGSVRKAGTRFRITAQLIRADNGYHLWSQVYDRDDSDVFAVQNDIAKAVVLALRAKLNDGSQDTGSRGTTNPEAYYRYLLGRQLDRRDSLDGFRRAVEAYGQAIDLDSNYAAAYAGRAVAEASVADLAGDAGGIDRAQRDVGRALALAPTDAIGYTARSYIRTVWLWDWSGAQTDIEKAISLDPRNSEVQRKYARLLADLGRLAEAIAAQKKATELDPLSSAAWENLGFFYTCIGDFESTEAALARAIDIEPASVLAISDLGMARLLQGRGEDALAAFAKIDLEAIRLTGIAMAEYTLRRAKESQQALDELIAKHTHEAAYQIAQAHAWRGETDRAFEWLERAYTQRDGGLSEVKIAPMLRSLHGDRRFAELVDKMKLPAVDAARDVHPNSGSRVR